MNVITVVPDATGFAENKQQAKELRITKILPALDRGEIVTLDFVDVRYATQSFVHALIGEALKKHGEPVLDRLEFRNCSAPVKSLVELVVDYSLGGFAQKQAV